KCHRENKAATPDATSRQTESHLHRKPRLARGAADVGLRGPRFYRVVLSVALSDFAASSRNGKSAACQSVSPCICEFGSKIGPKFSACARRTSRALPSWRCQGFLNSFFNPWTTRLFCRAPTAFGRPPKD